MELIGSLSEALSGNAWISALAALAWGFASPCHAQLTGLREPRACA